MGIFSSILDKIRHHAAADSGSQGGGQMGGQAQAPSPQQPQQRQSPQGSQQGGAPQSGSSQGAGAQQQQQPVDVEAVLTQLASKNGGGGNWRTSIVDLLKL